MLMHADARPGSATDEVLNMERPLPPAAPLARLLGPGEVVVALCGLEALEATVLAALAELDDEERGRAALFATSHDRRRFVLSHFALRRLLSGTCGMHASKLRFAKEALGRPFLLSPFSLDFNMSHASETAAYALAGNGRVGIDIEMIVPTVAAELAERVLAPVELGALRRMPRPAQAAAFFRWWTAKEAFLKLHGRGFSVEPNTVVVDLNCGIAACSAPELAAAHVAWLPAGNGAMCALATPNIVRRHDVSEWLARCAGLPKLDTGSSCAAPFQAQSDPKCIGTDTTTMSSSIPSLP